MESTIKDELAFSVLEIGNRYAVVSMHDGVELDLVKHNELMERIEERVNFPCVLILDDVNSYSVTLDVLMARREDRRICCFGVVAYRAVTHNIYRFAQDIIGKNTRFFPSRREAVAQVEQMLTRYTAA
jgi:hypothetical protein